MAVIAKTAFEARITNNEFNELCNVTGRYQEEGADAVCPAGLLVVRDALLPCAGYTKADGAALVNNENAWYMTAATADANADEVIYACNTYDWPLLSDGNGNAYAVGANILGLPIPAGRDGTFTVIVFDGQHVYRFGEGNLSAEMGSNKYFTIANGLLVPAAAAPTAAGSVYFELRGAGNFTAGASQSFGYVDVAARKVSAAPASNG